MSEAPRPAAGPDPADAPDPALPPTADIWLSREDATPEVLVVGVPSSKASLSRADLTPMAVRDRLGRFSTFHGEAGVDFGGDTMVRDVGNWPVSELDAADMAAEVERLARSRPDANLTLYLGGDSAITGPLVAAMSDDLSHVGVVAFGAGCCIGCCGAGCCGAGCCVDCCGAGTPESASAGASANTSIPRLIEERGLPGENVALLGAGAFADFSASRERCEAAGVAATTVADIEVAGMTAAARSALEALGECDSLYVDVDLGVLDRVFAPGCPAARPGGLTVRRLADGVRACAADPRTRAMGFVGVDAELDADGITLDAMAHLMLTAVVGLAER